MARNTRNDEFAGWASYPLNLPLSPVEVCAKRYNERLSCAGKRLFVEHDENQAGTLMFGPVRRAHSYGIRDVEYGRVDSTTQLKAYFERGYSSSVLSLLHQSYSWSRLQVSEKFLRKLFTHLQVHPDFLEILFLFGEKIGPVEESFSSFFSHCRPQNMDNPFVGPACSYDIGYNIKYVAPHMRSFPKDPFSIRETGVYHSFNADTQKSNWVFTQASDALKESLKHCFSHPDETETIVQFKIHGIILQISSAGWRDYLVYLEETFSKLASVQLLLGLDCYEWIITIYKMDQGFFANSNSRQLEGDFEADYLHIRKFHLLTDKVRRLLQILQLNTTVAEQMKCSIQRIKQHSPASLSAAFDIFESTIEMFILQHRTHTSRLQSMLDRAQGISALIQNLLEIRTTESSKKLAEISVQENKLIKTLTIQTTRDTKFMSVISLITAIFLPATFLATIFGMNFFDFQDNGIRISRSFWIYIVIAGSLSCFTVLLWFYWQRSVRAKSASEKEDIESNSEK